MALKLTKKSSITLSVPYNEAEAEAIKQDLQEIVDNTTADELRIIMKVSKRPSLKAMALNTAKKLL